jgi:hypothetical protein
MSEESTAAALGQLAFTTYYERQPGAADDMGPVWHAVSEKTRADWEAVAQGVIAAQQPHAAGDTRPLEQLAIAAFGAWIDATSAEHALLSWSQRPESDRAAFRAAADAVRMMLGMPGAQPQPAPGPAAATPYLDALSDALTRKVSEAEAERDDYAARLKAADQSWTQVATERDGLRELLDDIGTLAANAPEDGDCLAVLEDITMRIAAHGIPEGK